MLFGIDVIVVAPGAVATPIWDKAEAIDIAQYANDALCRGPEEDAKPSCCRNGRKGLPPERIGEAVRTALTTAKPKTRYTVAPNPLQQLMTATLPKRTMDSLIARRLGLTPPT